MNNFKESVEKFGEVKRRESVEKKTEVEKFRNNRQFITEVFYEVLNEGLKKMRELTPSDPFEFLVS